MGAVYVLTTLMGEGKGPREWRPVAVVTDHGVAEQWSNSDDANDWILFELDDLSLTYLAESPKKFEPAPPTPDEQKAEEDRRKAVEIARALEQSNAKLRGMVEEMEKKQRGRRTPKRSSAPAPGGPTAAPPASCGPPKAVVRAGAGDSARTTWRGPEWDSAWERWRQERWYHAQDCPNRRDWMKACDCLGDRLPGGKQGCIDCGFEKEYGHSPTCPRMRQGNLFASAKGSMPLRPGDRVGYYVGAAVGTVGEFRRNKEDPDRSVANVRWDGDLGTFDVPVNRLRRPQRNLFDLFASGLLRKKA